MRLEAAQQLELSIEKPAAGGRMIARHDQQVVLVEGAIPGERVIARIERIERQVAFADTLQIVESSPDRQVTDLDLRCGGCLYAHISYPRQVVLKGQLIQDAFTRLGRIPLTNPISVEPSPDRGYRMRARLHVRGDRVGFYREGTHELCDAAATGQLSDSAVACAQRAVESLTRSGHPVSSVELTENIAADERLLHLVPAPGATLTDAALEAALNSGGASGCTGRTAHGTLCAAGVPLVSDPLSILTGGRAATGILQRHAESFFQANRFLLPHLVTAVLDNVPAEGEVLDLYAGVGLFSVSLAASGRQRITAVEGDRASGSDLQRNAARCGAVVRVAIGSVEDYVKRRKGPAAQSVIVDPPRTGISREAMLAIVAHGASRILYVSCDPATMARDARRLLDGGYRMTSLQGFDLFPNTPHVEAIGVFDNA